MRNSRFILPETGEKERIETYVLVRKLWDPGDHEGNICDTGTIILT